MNPLRVAVDARLAAGTAGGIETVVLGLAQGFAQLQPSDIDPRLCAYPAGANSLVTQAPGVTIETLRRASIPTRGLRQARISTGTMLGAATRHVPKWTVIRRDRALDGVRPDLVHYPYPSNLTPSVPFVYQPHDLQHLHYPQFFRPRDIRWREVVFPVLCHKAAAVAVGNRWVKYDLVDRYGVSPDKIFVIPLAPVRVDVTESDAAPVVQGPYLLYPAVNWPHKNHARLLQAFASAADNEPDMQLVLTGAIKSQYPHPAAMAARLGLSERVHVLGYVDTTVLASLYAHARGVVVPTLFEAASFPVWEAFQRGVPVACSNVTSLPEQTAGHAVLFDPTDVAAMSDAMVRLWTDATLRAKLIRGGKERVAQFTWERTARGFAALYRYVAGRSLSDEDEALLAAEAL